jgi:hypothetical protein
MIKGLLDTKTTIPSAKEIAKNTQNAIKNFALAPQNPSLPNTAYWKKMADMWRITPAQAERRRCGNCEYYENTPDMLEAMEAIPLNKYDLYDGQAQRGYCHKLDFICHNSRVCSVWEEKEYEQPEDEMESEDA